MPPIKTSPVVAIENIDVIPSIPGIPPTAPPTAAPQPIAPVKTPTPCGIDDKVAFVTTGIFIIAAGGRCVSGGRITRGLIFVQVVGTIFLCSVLAIGCIGSGTVKATIRVEIIPPIETGPVVVIPDVGVIPSVPSVPPTTPPRTELQSVTPVKAPTPRRIEVVTFVPTDVAIEIAIGGRRVGGRG